MRKKHLVSGFLITSAGPHRSCKGTVQRNSYEIRLEMTSLTSVTFVLKCTVLSGHSFTRRLLHPVQRESCILLRNRVYSWVTWNWNHHLSWGPTTKAPTLRASHHTSSPVFCFPGDQLRAFPTEKRTDIFLPQIPITRSL